MAEKAWTGFWPPLPKRRFSTSTGKRSTSRCPTRMRTTSWLTLSFCSERQHRWKTTAGDDSLFDAVVEFFNHRISQDFPGDALHLRLSRGSVQTTVQHDLKKLALADAINSLISHLLQRAVDGFALRIEHRVLQHDRNVSLHGDGLIIDEPGMVAERALQAA